MGLEKEYEDIPGTYVFDAERSRQGYHLNQFCISLRLQKNRDEFNAGEEAYLDKYPMTPDQRQAVLDRDWNGLLGLGGNIYYTSKLAANDGINFQQLAGIMTGMGNDAYRAMMLAGGRSPEGNRYQSEWDDKEKGDD
ncbi:MAG: protocatechuate 4,5-dioxygenase subunit alpha [Pseudomonadota bacterium]